MDNHSVASQVRIRYLGTEAFCTASVIHTWRKEDPEILRGPVMSTSSGEKDYLINRILVVFGGIGGHKPESVTMLCLNRTPFLVARIGCLLVDVATGRPVEIRNGAESAERAA